MKAIFALADSEAIARVIVKRLQEGGLSPQKISILYSEHLGIKSANLLSGAETLAIPGLGPFIAVGPILKVLNRSAVGKGVGLLVGALIEMGLPDHEARKYELGLKDENVLIGVSTDEYDEENLATVVFEKEGAKEIAKHF